MNQQHKLSVISKTLAAFGVAAAALAAVPASAETVTTTVVTTPTTMPTESKPGGVQAGFLTCNVASGWGFIIGSSRKLRCVWEPEKGVQYNYNGTVGQFGVDIGYHRSSVILWTVVSATSDKGAKSLEGSYGGVTVQASAGVGAGVSALVGGFKKSFTLQPFSISGETGINAAAGIQTLTLKRAAG